MRKIRVKRIIRTAVFAASVIIGIFLTGHFGKNVKYSECIISREQADDIIAMRDETTCLIDNLIFGEESLFYDDSDNTFYYSLTGGG